MSPSVNISEARLRAGVVKLAVGLAGLMTLIGVLLSLLADHGLNLAVAVLLISVAFNFLVNGVFVVLKIIDWFEARQSAQ